MTVVLVVVAVRDVVVILTVVVDCVLVRSRVTVGKIVNQSGSVCSSSEKFAVVAAAVVWSCSLCRQMAATVVIATVAVVDHSGGHDCNHGTDRRLRN